MTKELLKGLSRFRAEYFPRHREQYQRLVEEGQSPKTLFIGCSDSRVIPDILTASAPGELFVIRNVGNMVPAYEEDTGQHGVSAGIEFAVEILKVRDIVVCGHTHCGAIRALYEPPPEITPHIRRWLALAEEAQIPGELSEEILRRTEQRSVVLQLDRLMSFPGVRSRIEAGDLALYGWHFAIETGTVKVFDAERGVFTEPQ